MSSYTATGLIHQRMCAPALAKVSNSSTGRTRDASSYQRRIFALRSACIGYCGSIMMQTLSTCIRARPDLSGAWSVACWGSKTFFIHQMVFPLRVRMSVSEKSSVTSGWKRLRMPFLAISWPFASQNATCSYRMAFIMSMSSIMAWMSDQRNPYIVRSTTRWLSAR